MTSDPDLATIYRQLKGDATSEEVRALERWRGASAENEKTFQSLQHLWRRTEGRANPPELDLEQGWRRLAARLGMEVEQQQGDFAPTASGPVPFRDSSGSTGPSRRGPSPLRWALLAAVLLTAALLGVWFSRGLRTDSWREYTTTQGQHHLVTLPEGSTVRLNAGSALRFDSRWQGKSREVFLSGQAYFEIVHDGRPFLVHTENAQVRVLGTRFDVWARNHKTRVVVRDGKVSLSAGKGTGEVLLEARQAAIQVGGNPPQMLESLDAEAALSWILGNIVYQHQALGDVVVDLERLFGARILLSDPALENRTVSATFGDERLDTILDELCLTLNLHYTFDGSTYRIQP